MPCFRMAAKNGPFLFIPYFQRSFLVNTTFDFDTSSGKLMENLVTEMKIALI